MKLSTAVAAESVIIVTIPLGKKQIQLLTRSSMTTEADRHGVIKLSAQQLQHPELLTGLEVWLQLGLLSQAQVEQFCQLYLSCKVPDVQREISQREISQPAQPIDRAVPVAASTDFADSVFADSVPVPSRSPNWVARSLQALMAEIGVIWLLCLGVFLVVVSSGVLAASQWRNFPPVGQYSILLAYTLAFWGVSLWTERQPTLQLTTRMLQTTTLLIIPVNFWMMDGLHLWQSGIGTIVSLLAALLLMGLTRFLTVCLAATESRPGLITLNSLGLSSLHWGWSIAGIPLIATYIGTIGTACLTYIRARLQSEAPSRISPTTLSIALATLLLLGRAILVAQVPLDQLGLAFGVCGWLFCWLTRTETVRNPLSNLWTGVGMGLLLLGWAITIAAEPPWQAFAISGLALWLLGDRLRRQGNEATLMALLLLGLQTYTLLWRLLPIELRQSIVASAAQLMGSGGMPVVLLGLAGFPYLWLMLVVAQWLRRQQPHLAQIPDLMALGLGVILTAISVTNPIVQSLNLTLAALTLAIILRRRSLPHGWYLNHLLILAAVCSWIDATLPNLDDLAWARILLIGMGIEWSLSLGEEREWRQSCWHFGLGLAGLSYVLLPNWFTSTNLSAENLIWLATPALLSGLSRLRQFHHPRLAAWLSAGGLLAQLLLLNTVDTWLISLAAATGLMLINTLTLQRFAAALLTLALALSFEATALYRYFAPLRFDWVVLLLAGNLWLLWLAQDWLSRRDGLRQHYAAAANFWAGAIVLFSLISLTLHNLAVYAFSNRGVDWAISGRLVISSGLIAAAMVYHLRRQGATEQGFYELAWATELLAVTLLGWQQGSIEALAIVTLALGLTAQLLGDWISRSRQVYRLSWQVVPLLYAGFGTLLGHHRFTATTGLYTLTAALIGIGIGRRQERFKPLTLASLLLGSIAAYELLIYQLMQANVGNAGDGITFLAGLAALIAISVQLGKRWLLPYLHLLASELVWFAHLYWGVGSGLALLALPLTLSKPGFPLWFLMASSLAAYALLNGRHSSVQQPSVTENWTYIGILQAWSVISYTLYRAVPEINLLLAWAGTLAAIGGVVQYFLPWRVWGWSRRPWGDMAMLLPGMIVLLTASEIALQSLLIVAAFYAWIAKAERRSRLSYLSVFLFDWAAWRFLKAEDWLNLPWVGALTASSLLYLVQIDPALQGDSAREQRHWLRLLAVGLLSLTLLYQAEVEAELMALLLRLLTLILAVGLVFGGLVLRVRAFLYVGTVTFVLQVFRLLWLFINTYSLLLWAIGIVIGLIFIWIAATFEARRSQVNALMQYWLVEFTNWE